MRRPEGTGLCCAMISFTLETAVGVSVTAVCGAVSTPGVVIDDIVALLEFLVWKPDHYTLLVPDSIGLSFFSVFLFSFQSFSLVFRCGLGHAGRKNPGPQQLS